MEPGSYSRRSRADEVKEEEVSLSAARSALHHLPPLTAVAHATHVLCSSSLDPDVEPFIGSPGESEGCLHLTDLEASFGEGLFTHVPL